MFKIRLLTPRVSKDSSNVAGDEITVDNDEAYMLIKNGLGELVGKKAPQPPKQEPKDAD